jgi:hypothetical protein
MSCASCGDGERRLEAEATLGIDDELVPLHVWAREVSQRVRRREAKARSREGVAIAARPRRNLGFKLPVLAAPAS